MSDLAKQLFDGLKNVMHDIGAEVHRQGILGSSELAAALFKGGAFVMYGPGQRAARVEQEHTDLGHSVSAPENQPDQTHGVDGQTHEIQIERGR